MLSGRAKLAGVMGWPVAHSKSPALHGFWLRELAIDGAYVPLAVRPENLAQALKALPALGFSGVNLTVPHKEAALALVDEVETTARRIGAINCVTVDPAGRLLGSNTDAYGFLTNLTTAVPHLVLAGTTAVVLGAGGAARAVCVALTDAGARLRITNRNHARAAALAADLGGAIDVVAWEARHEALANAGVLVNTTSLGMQGQPPLTIDLAALPQTAVVNDIVYAPLETALLAAARARGLRCVDGLGMLLYQAQPAFARWFGVSPAVTPALRAHVLGPA
jgi:shikimate dehydrogenase